MSQEGQTMTLQLVKSLRIAHPKEKLSADNTFNNNGEIKNNFVSYGGNNSVNQNVTVGGRQWVILYPTNIYRHHNNVAIGVMKSTGDRLENSWRERKGEDEVGD